MTRTLLYRFDHLILAIIGITVITIYAGILSAYQFNQLQNSYQKHLLVLNKQSIQQLDAIFKNLVHKTESSSILLIKQPKETLKKLLKDSNACDSSTKCPNAFVEGIGMLNNYNLETYTNNNLSSATHPSIITSLLVADALSQKGSHLDFKIGNLLPATSKQTSDLLPVYINISTKNSALDHGIVYVIHLNTLLHQLANHNNPLLIRNEKKQDLTPINTTNHTRTSFRFDRETASANFPYSLSVGTPASQTPPNLWSLFANELMHIGPMGLILTLFAMYYRKKLLYTVGQLSNAAYKLGQEEIDITIPRRIPNKELLALTKSILKIKFLQKDTLNALLSLSTVNEQQDEELRLGEHADKMKLEILREIRHRTCNFLNAISMTSQMMLCHLRKESNIVMSQEHQEEALKRIDILVRHIEAFTTDTLECEFFDPCQTVQECLTLQRRTLLRGGIHFIFHANPLLPPIYADKIRFIQAINGLIRRSSDFLVGGETITVTLDKELSEGDEYLTITIHDNGYGLTEKKRQELIEMHDGRGIERDIDGIELSIASVRKLLILHGGDLTINDEWGKGSVLVVRIPYPKSTHSGVVCEPLPLPTNVTYLFKPKPTNDDKENDIA